MGESVALFIDLENVVTSLWKAYQQPPDFFTWLDKVRKYGPLAFGKAYGDFNQPTLSRLSGDLRALGIEQVNCPVKQNGQSTVDGNIIFDLFEVAVDRPTIDTIVLMGGDSDYIRVVAKLRLRFNKDVVIMGVAGSVSRDLARAAGTEELLGPVEVVADDTAVIRLIERYEASRRPGVYPTFRFMRDYLAYPQNAAIIDPRTIDNKLNEFMRSGVLMQEVISGEKDDNQFTSTKLNREHEDVRGALGQE